MLTIAKLGVGQESYYLSKVAQGIEDYYTGQGESAGAWLGRGAARLGLGGEVAGSELRAVLGGVDPVTGRRLAGREGAKRTPGWDLTFSAPKSVSVLFGLGDEAMAKEVGASHRVAVEAGLAYLEAHATVSRRRVDGEIAAVRGEGLVVAAFGHRTSRAGDPQLHTHALVANVVEHIDGGSGAIHSPVIFRHARTAGFIYQAVLRGELTDRLGVRWDPVHNGYAEIEGMDRRLLEVFSKRRAEIEAALAERGEDSARAAQVAAHRTRAAKEYGVDAQTLHERWAAEAADVGFEAAAFEELVGRGAPAVAEDDLRGAVDAMVSEHGLTSQRASFDHRDVVRAWCESLPAGTKVTLDALEDLADVVESDERVIPVVDGRALLTERSALERPDGQVTGPGLWERRWSTTDMLEVERRLLADAGPAGADCGAGAIPTAVVEQALASQRDLAGEQAAMVHRVTTSGDAVEVVVGRAGSGKTYALAAAAEIWRDAGYRPIGLGLAARAAYELESTAGIPSTTVARFLIDLDQAPGILNERHVLVVDEAGMVDTRRLGRLVRHAQLAGAKVVLVGDHHQLPPVEAGGAFGGLVIRGEDRLCELASNRRQREMWERDTLERLRGGASGRAGIEDLVTEYRRHGRLHVGETPAEVRVAMVRDWDRARRDGASVAMLALRRSDVDELNARARTRLVADGVVDRAGLDVGDRTFAVGDRVVCLDNDRRLGVHNAMFATVLAVDYGAGELVVSPEGENTTCRLPEDYVAEHLDHAYATTIHKAQGATYDRVLLLGDDRLYRQAGYTGLSRGRDRNDIYLVVDDDREHDPELERHGAIDEDHPVERFVRALNRDGAKLMASDERDSNWVDTTSEPLSGLWARRDILVHELTQCAPPDTSTRTENALDVARAKEAQATIMRGIHEERVEALRGGRHRREREEARRDLDWALANEDRQRAEREELEAVAAAGLRTNTEWLREHRDEVKEVAGLEFEIARRVRLAGVAAEVDRPDHVVAALGEPPVDLEGRDRWRRAAGAMESYSARWGTMPDPSTDHRLASLESGQAAHLAFVERAVAATVADPAEIACGPSLDL
jgi:conjugative relaxase-like TrwC/TraI family protein